MMQTATVRFPVIANFYDHEDGKDYARFLSFATGEKVSFSEVEVPLAAEICTVGDFNNSSRACYYFKFNIT